MATLFSHENDNKTGMNSLSSLTFLLKLESLFTLQILLKISMEKLN